ncbi:hypothetical protein [Paenibacillus sp. 1-18]|uniref:hypothetical protein n=1 Tax=Paenibacillus sp. 1-18 TaxID=1333846 RepID=UPI003FA5919E
MIKLGLIFRWYFEYSNRLALSGSKENIVDYQVYCGSALGAFNQWVKGTDISMWKNRHVDEIGEKIMNVYWRRVYGTKKGSGKHFIRFSNFRSM